MSGKVFALMFAIGMVAGGAADQLSAVFDPVTPAADFGAPVIGAGVPVPTAEAAPERSAALDLRVRR